jgi:hypothetical protein
VGIGASHIACTLASGGLTTPGALRPNFLWGPYTGGRNGVSKGIEYGHRPPTLWADHPEKPKRLFQGWPSRIVYKVRAWQALTIL